MKKNTLIWLWTVLFVIIWIMWAISYPHIPIYSGWAIYIVALVSGVTISIIKNDGKYGIILLMFGIASFSPTVEILWGIDIGVKLKDLIHPEICGASCFNIMGSWSYFVLVFVIPIYLFFASKQEAKK